MDLGILNIFLIAGTSAIISEVKYSVQYNKDILILFLGTILFAIFPFISKKDCITKGKGLIFLTIYIIYFLSNILFEILI